MAAWQWLRTWARVCLCCLTILLQMVQRSDEIFFHLRRFDYVGASLLRQPLQRQSDFQAGLPLLSSTGCLPSLPRQKGWLEYWHGSVLLFLHLSRCLRVTESSMLLAAPGCSAMTVITSAVGLNCLLVYFSLVCRRSAKNHKSLHCMSLLYLTNCAFL